MGVIVVDTSVLIDHLRGHAPATRRMQQAAKGGDELCASVVTRVELLWNMRADEKRDVRALFAATTWLPVTELIAEQAGTTARTYRSSHGSIDLADYLIAATATVHDAALWTRNLKHFPMFGGLAAPYEAPDTSGR